MLWRGPHARCRGGQGAPCLSLPSRSENPVAWTLSSALSPIPHRPCLSSELYSDSLMSDGLQLSPNSFALASMSPTDLCTLWRGKSWNVKLTSSLPGLKSSADPLSRGINSESVTYPGSFLTNHRPPLQHGSLPGPLSPTRETHSTAGTVLPRPAAKPCRQEVLLECRPREPSPLASRFSPHLYHHGLSGSMGACAVLVQSCRFIHEPTSAQGGRDFPQTTSNDENGCAY